jgi:2'-5' RNA ligase
VTPTRTALPGILRNHWTPRPGWSAERSLVATYLTLDGSPDAVAALQAYQAELIGLPQVDLVPAEWLHVTVQGIAFADEVPATAAARLAAALAERLAHLPAPRVRLDPPEPGGEGIYLPLTPAEALVPLRDTIRATATDELGLSSLYGLPGQDGAFSPHASFAYTNADLPVEEVMIRLAAVPHVPVELEVTSVAVIALRRSDRRWWWTDRHDVRVGPAR